MTQEMNITEETKLTDILKSYPWLVEEALKIDSRFQLINSPLGKIMLRNATIAELSRKSGLPSQEIIDKIQEMIAARQEE